MTLREVIEQYTLWRQAHGGQVHERGEPPASLPPICRRRCRLRRGDHDPGSGLSGRQRAAGPVSREQVLRPCRPLAPCDQPWPCDALAAPEQRTEITGPDAARPCNDARGAGRCRTVLRLPLVAGRYRAKPDRGWRACLWMTPLAARYPQFLLDAPDRPGTAAYATKVRWEGVYRDRELDESIVLHNVL